MSTFEGMVARIADDIARADLSATQIPNAIQSAIRHYERTRFYFNETRVSFSVTTSQEWVTVTDLADLPNIIQFDTLSIRINQTIYPLIRRTFAYLEEIMSSTNIFADPTEFCIYRQQIRLYPPTQNARPLIASYFYKLASLSASTDTNAWTTDAEEMIRSRAEWDLYARVIKDLEAAGIAKQQEMDAKDALDTETLLRMSSGTIQPQKGNF